MPTAPHPRRTWSDEMAEANYPLGPLVEDWLLTERAAAKSPETIATYRSLVTGLLRWFEASFQREAHAADLGDGTNGRRLVERYLLDRQREGRAARTLNTTLAALRRFTAWAHTSGFLATNTVTEVRPVKLPHRLLTVLSEEELDRIEAAIAAGTQPQRDELLFRLLLGTGLRRAELAGLLVADVTVRDGRGAPLLYGQLRLIGKGDKERLVGLGKGDTSCLRRWLETRPERGGRPAPADERAAEYVLLGRAGQPITPGHLAYIVTSWGRAAAVPRLHPHLLRHTFATSYLLTRGQDGTRGDVASLNALLGHASLQQTMHYAHLVKRAEVVEQHQRTSPTDARDARKRPLNPHSRHAASKSPANRAQKQARKRGA